VQDVGNEIRQMSSWKKSYIEFGSQSREVIFEDSFYFATGCFPAWNDNTVFCARCDIDKLLELWVFECLDGLRVTVSRKKNMVQYSAHLVCGRDPLNRLTMEQ
jgi:hypothetical protein